MRAVNVEPGSCIDLDRKTRLRELSGQPVELTRLDSTMIICEKDLILKVAPNSHATGIWVTPPQTMGHPVHMTQLSPFGQGLRRCVGQLSVSDTLTRIRPRAVTLDSS
jgi:hypothetical protein